ncbi:KPN_02809 family neutral zinc metallopeptidase [Peptoniphilaceae bacterium SGI.131]
MKWRDRRTSDNVEKRSASKGFAGGFGMMPKSLGGLVALFLLVWALGGNPLDLIGNMAGLQNTDTTSQYEARDKEEAEIEDFLSVVLADTEDVWREIFAKNGKVYKEPKLVLYQDRVSTSCGLAASNTGPFYCSADESVYIDVSFAKLLRSKFGVGGDFPFAYILAHEVGHHVQYQLGILQKIHNLKNEVSSKTYNQYMVRLELQADYFAGLFAHYMKNKNYMEVGDLEEALSAVSAVGDDTIQSMNGQTVNPDTFQHGTSKQRLKWFKRGYEYGDLENGDTFNTDDL